MSTAATPVLSIPAVAAQFDQPTRLVLSGHAWPPFGDAGSWTSFGDGLVPDRVENTRLDQAVRAQLAKSSTALGVRSDVASLATEHGLDAGQAVVLVKRALNHWTEHGGAAQVGRVEPAAMQPQAVIDPAAVQGNLVKSQVDLLRKGGRWCDDLWEFPALQAQAARLERQYMEASNTLSGSHTALQAQRQTLPPADYEKARDDLWKQEDRLQVAFTRAKNAIEIERLRMLEASASARQAQRDAEAVRNIPQVVPSMSAFELASGETEIPAWLGEALWNDPPSLVKGAGHSYMRRVPTGNPERPYRYVYRAVTKTGNVADDHHFVAGASFAGKDGSKKGHFHVEKVTGDHVHVKHDETGAVHKMSKAELRSMLNDQHAKAVTQAHKKQGRTSIGQTKSGKHVFAPGKKAVAAIAQHVATGKAAHGGAFDKPEEKIASAKKHALKLATAHHARHSQDFTPADHRDAKAMLTQAAKAASKPEHRTALESFAHQHGQLAKNPGLQDKTKKALDGTKPGAKPDKGKDKPKEGKKMSKSQTDTDIPNELEALIKSQGATSFAEATAGAPAAPSTEMTVSGAPSNPAPVQTPPGLVSPGIQGGIPGAGDSGQSMSLNVPSNPGQVHLVAPGIVGGADGAAGLWAENHLGKADLSLDFSEWSGGSANISLMDGAVPATPVKAGELTLQKSENAAAEEDDEDDDEDEEDMNKSARAALTSDQAAQAMVKSQAALSSGNHLDWGIGLQVKLGTGAPATPYGAPVHYDPRIHSFDPNG